MSAWPTIVRDTTYLIWNGEGHYPGSYNVKKGTKIEFKLTVFNSGERGAVYVWLYDYKNGKEIWGMMFDMDEAETRRFSGSFIIKKTMHLKFESWYWDGSKWVKADAYG
ncbi:hypothetical protein J7L81_05620 [Candidatus Aerophobetes bacterium]|nr:hypothetical protein [Candidatus Aerophobetes bacterium]